MNEQLRRVVQFFYDPAPVMQDTKEAIWLLGVPYDPEDSSSWSEQESRGWPSSFLEDFESRIYCSYRKNFALIKAADQNLLKPPGILSRVRGSSYELQGFTSDAGWGCMIRTAQSLLANCILHLDLGRDWRLRDGKQQDNRIVSLFADEEIAPFSIHAFVSHGDAACGKHPGEWFGPSAAVNCIQ